MPEHRASLFNRHRRGKKKFNRRNARKGHQMESRSAKFNHGRIRGKVKVYLNKHSEEFGIPRYFKRKPKTWWDELGTHKENVRVL